MSIVDEEQAGNSETASLAEVEQTELSLGRFESSRGSGRQGGNTNSKNSVLGEEIGLVQGKETGRKHSLSQSIRTPSHPLKLQQHSLRDR